MLRYLKQRGTALMVDRSGISSMEYAALAVGVIGAVLAGATIFGNALSTYLGNLLTAAGL
jgi:Flp pilus assembly pilin Flp